MKSFQASLEFGLKIKELRQKEGLTSTEFIQALKDKVDLKITTGYITYIELYGTIPHSRIIKKFAQFFDIRPPAQLSVKFKITNT
ncbi:hypothetical protein AGMMS50222_09010 [Endomicrobiia bacterium]|nr:hypothetical protein AGMMS49556_04010 [Endomicrobiia bacterium]GHT69525.1 hypothetical protein AGMMS49950_02430 [Endomicrobiia bacterium]GHT76439.1 hypothetical protein AGMMS50222_09010 [Endomicrobiia bacterium]